MRELWRRLKIGDKVQVVARPPDWPTMHEETREFFKWLIETKKALTIDEIEKLPWGKICRVVDGVRHYEKVPLNHGGLELVGRERPSRIKRETMSELWRRLKIGDRVRVVAKPPYWPTTDDKTREFFKWLIETKKALTIVEIQKLPWGDIRRIVGGVECYDKVLLNHGGLKLVGRKRPSRKKK